MKKCKSIFQTMIYNKWLLVLTVCMEVYFMFYLLTIHWSIFPMIFALPFYVYSINRSRMAARTEIKFYETASLDLAEDKAKLEEIQTYRAQCDRAKRDASILYGISMLFFFFLYWNFNSLFH